MFSLITVLFYPRSMFSQLYCLFTTMFCNGSVLSLFCIITVLFSHRPVLSLFCFVIVLYFYCSVVSTHCFVIVIFCHCSVLPPLIFITAICHYSVLSWNRLRHVSFLHAYTPKKPRSITLQTSDIAI